MVRILRKVVVPAFSAVTLMALALGTGIVQKADSLRSLEMAAEGSVARCMASHGLQDVSAVDATFSEIQRRTRAVRTLDSCWRAVAHDKRFARLGTVDPVLMANDLRRKGVGAWTCMSRSSWKRTTAIPLSGQNGYPLQIAAGNFSLTKAPGEIDRFYKDAARCSNEPVSAFRWSNGRFSTEPADGTDTCMRHTHRGSGDHAHGCFWLRRSGGTGKRSG